MSIISIVGIDTLLSKSRMPQSNSHLVGQELLMGSTTSQRAVNIDNWVS